MREQLSKLLTRAGGRIEDIFSTGQSMADEADEVAAGAALVEDLAKQVGAGIITTTLTF